MGDCRYDGILESDNDELAKDEGEDKQEGVDNGDNKDGKEITDSMAAASSSDEACGEGTKVTAESSATGDGGLTGSLDVPATKLLKRYGGRIYSRDHLGTFMSKL